MNGAGNTLGKAAKKNAPTSTNKLTYFQRFSLFFFRNKKISLVLWVITIAFGLATYISLIQREGFPSVQVPISVVNASYFVNDKTRVDTEIGAPIANALKGMSEIKSVSTISSTNFSTAIITYNANVPAEEGAKLVQAKIDAAKLPTQAKVEYRSIEASKFANGYNLLVGVYAKDGDNSVAATTKAAAGLAEHLGGVDGVKSSVVISQLKSATDPRSGQEVEIQDSFDSIGIEEGGDGLKFYSTVNVGITFEQGQDALDASDAISTAINAYVSEGKLQGYDAKISSDFAPQVRLQIASLQQSMLEGFIIIAFVSFLLVSWRAGLATALTMITVLVTTVTVLYLFGLTLNVISLFALILSLGLIVDDATIVSEAIDSMKDHSKERADVIKEAIGKIARASTAGTLVTIFAFVPMLFINGILGGFIRAIPITIIISLVLSLVISLSLIPFFGSSFLLTRAKKKPKHNPIQKAEKYVSLKLSNIIRYTGKHHCKGSIVVIGFIILSLVSTMVGGAYFSKAGFDIFPKEKDSTELLVSITFRPGSTLPEAIEQSAQVNQIIAKESVHIKQVTYINSGSTQSANASIGLTELDQREDTSVQIADRLQKDLDGLRTAGIIARASSTGAGGPTSDFPLEIRVVTADKENATKLLTDLQAKLSQTSLATASGKDFKVTRFLKSDTTNLIKRINGETYISLSVGFDQDSSTELIETTRTFVEENAQPENYGLSTGSIQTDAGFEESSQESFKSMLIAFPIMLITMYILLTLLFKSFLQALFIFLAIPFSFLGVGMGLYYTNNSASFFVMLGFFALIGIALNNTILITDFANQERRKGVGRVDAIANALQARFRPLLTTSITGVVALIPLALQDPFWQSLSVTLIFGLLSSTLLVILCFPYYLVAVEVLRSFGRKLADKLKRKN